MFNTICTGARLTLLAALAAFSQSALALGLGNASVESYLNQPLRANIDVITREGDDLSSATVGMASADDFALIGASLEAVPVPLSFALEQGDAGTHIVVTSILPVKDPVVRLIVELNWSNGRLLREYTLFLDPSTTPAPAPAPAAPPVVDERGRAPIAPPPADAEWVPAQQNGTGQKAASSRTAAAGRSATPGNEYGPVQSGDTLWRIANNWSNGTGLDTNAVMVAIQRKNPDAFIHNNINLLMRGAILRMPQADEVREISALAARDEVVKQSQEFAEERLVTAAETPLVDSASQPLPAANDGGRNGPVDQLELVPPAEDADAGSTRGPRQSVAGTDESDDAEYLREELSRKEEELIVEQQKNEYLQDQIDELQERLQPGTEGNVADAELAQLEDRLHEERMSEGSAGTSESPAAEMDQSGTKSASEGGSEAIPQVTTPSAAKSSGSWFGSLTMWLIIVLIVGAAGAGWLLSRRSSAGGFDAPVAPDEGRGTMRQLKDEAQGILNTLKTDEGSESPDKTAETGPAKEGPDKEVPGDGGAREAAVDSAPRRARTGREAPPSDEAELLDAESADPEVRLDLARAYISMGDREAARVILDEVVEHGTEEQKAEAEKMLNDL